MMRHAHALLHKNVNASDGEIRRAPEPHLRRCGTHMRILKAVHRAAELMQAAPAMGAIPIERASPSNLAPLAHQGVGSLVVSFSLPARARASRSRRGRRRPAFATPKLPGQPRRRSLSRSVDPPRVERGRYGIRIGKAELGQGIKTALLQVAAGELGLPVERLTIVTADASRTPNEGYTAGSHTMQDSGAAIRNAAAQMRELLIDQAARRLNLPADELKAENGAVIAPDGRSLAYGALVGETNQHVRAQPVSKLRDPATFKVLNTPMHRVDIPAKVTGGAAYVQDMRVPGMLHARVVRPPSYGAQLRSADIDGAAKTPGVAKVIRDGNFLAVVATGEFQAIKASEAAAPGGMERDGEAADPWQSG